MSPTAPSAAGTYYYGACVDAVTDESDTTNNCSSSVQVTVTAPTPSAPAPDQVAAEVAPSPSAAGAGNGEFYVHWIPSGDGGSAITKYQYRVWETGQTAPATWTDISLSDSALLHPRRENSLQCNRHGDHHLRPQGPGAAVRIHGRVARGQYGRPGYGGLGHADAGNVLVRDRTALLGPGVDRHLSGARVRGDGGALPAAYQAQHSQRTRCASQ